MRQCVKINWGYLTPVFRSRRFNEVLNIGIRSSITFNIYKYMTNITINNKDYLEAFQRGDYPALVRIADSFALSLAMDAMYDREVASNVSAHFLNQHENNNENG